MGKGNEGRHVIRYRFNSFTSTANGLDMLLIASLVLILPILSDAKSFKGQSETTNESLMKMVDNEWMDKFIPREYKRVRTLSGSGEQDVTKDNNFGFSEQGMKDLDEVGGLVGGGDSDLLGILRPYYSMVEMTANGNKQGMGQYLHVLPDSSEGDTPIYSVGGSMYGGIEPAGAKLGYMNRPFGKR